MSGVETPDLPDTGARPVPAAAIVVSDPLALEARLAPITVIDFYRTEEAQHADRRD